MQTSLSRKRNRSKPMIAQSPRELHRERAGDSLRDSRRESGMQAPH